MAVELGRFPDEAERHLSVLGLREVEAFFRIRAEARRLETEKAQAEARARRGM